MKAVKRDIEVQTKDGRETVSAAVYGNLALLGWGKLPKAGRQISAYLIIHVPSGLRLAGPIRGHKQAQEKIGQLLHLDWSFDNAESDKAAVARSKAADIISRINEEG